MPHPEVAPVALGKSLGVATRPTRCKSRAARPDPENANMTAMATRACIVMMGICRAASRATRSALALTSMYDRATPPTSAMSDETSAR